MARCHSRAALTSQLLRERTVARFIVAPDGFGKTAAAMEYADVVFGFEHVFWIRCDSPCFLRDLDAGTIAQTLKDSDSEPGLVVFEDLPRFDEDRRRQLSDLIDALLQWSFEVIVTCAPSCDGYADLQHDRLCITSEMLLLSDDELTIEGLRDLGAERTPSCRTPCMVWAKEGEKLLINGLRREELPADLVVGALLLLMLGQGSFEELEAILGTRWAARVIENFAESYPYAGINHEEGSFYATPISVKGLAASIGRGFASLMAACPITDRDQLIRRIADMLLIHGQQQRACDIVMAFCTVKGITEWMKERGGELLSKGAFDAIVSLHRRLERRRQEKSPANELITLTAYAMVGDVEESNGLARRILLSKSSSEYHRTIAWIVQLLFASAEDQPRLCLLAHEFLDACSQTASLALGDESELDRHQTADAQRLLTQLIAIAKSTDPSALWSAYVTDHFENARYKSTVFEVLSMTAVLTKLKTSITDDEASATDARRDFLLTAASADSIYSVVLDVIESIESLARTDGFGVPEAVVVDGLLRVLRLWPDSVQPTVNPWVYDIVNDRMLIARRQRRSYEGIKRRAIAARSVDAHPTTARPSQKAISGILESMPIMTVNLFGGFKVSIGERALSAKELSRQKSRQLLALLVLHHGREVPKDRLIAMLWPDHDEIGGAKCLYGAWSKLKKVISVDGVCPFIYRSPSGFRIVQELVDSDVYHFEELCRSMMFAPTMPVDWQETFRRITEEFGDDLLPGEKNNATIEVARRRFRSQLVDGLVSVSRRLERAGEAQGAIWFAREAVDRDPSREDAHMALMQAQISANQRSSALESYFNCRTQLAERLGIDPSPGLIRLYRSIIEEEVEV